MIKISGCCDGCGKGVSFDNANGFVRVPVYIDVNEEPLVSHIEYFAFCSSCIKELAQIPGGICEQIAELQRRHDRHEC